MQEYTPLHRMKGSVIPKMRLKNNKLISLIFIGCQDPVLPEMLFKNNKLVSPLFIRWKGLLSQKCCSRIINWLVCYSWDAKAPSYQKCYSRIINQSVIYRMKGSIIPKMLLKDNKSISPLFIECKSLLSQKCCSRITINELVSLLFIGCEAPLS